LLNRADQPDDAHFELLFRYGLGVDVPSAWGRRLGSQALPTPHEALEEQLALAVERALPDRVALLVRHGIARPPASGGAR
jgi:hypothetical protein